MTIFLIRHAESAPDPDIPEPQWPLSPNGHHQAKSLISTLETLNLSQLYSSPFPRAIETLRPFADHSKLSIQVIQDFRERKLTDGMVKDFLSILQKTWQDFDYKLPKCESSRECQVRFRSALEEILEPVDKNIGIASHGNAIGLFLNLLDPSFGFENWKEISNPDIFKINWQQGKFDWDRDCTWRPSVIE